MLTKNMSKSAANQRSQTGLDLDGALMLASSLAFEARASNEVEPLFADAERGTLQQAQARLHGASAALAHLRRPDGLLLYFQPVLPLDAREELSAYFAGVLR